MELCIQCFESFSGLVACREAGALKDVAARLIRTLAAGALAVRPKPPPVHIAAGGALVRSKFGNPAPPAESNLGPCSAECVQRHIIDNRPREGAALDPCILEVGGLNALT